MQGLLTVIFLGIAANLDNLCVGMSYGMMGRRIRFLDNLIISGVSGLTAYIACAAAGLISAASVHLAAYVGPAILILLGILSVIAAFRGEAGPHDKKEKATRRRAGRLTEVFALSIALALNGIAEAFGAGLSGLPAIPLALSVTLFSALALGFGGIFGKKIRALGAGRWLNAVSGLLLIGVGIYQFLG